MKRALQLECITYFGGGGGGGWAQTKKIPFLFIGIRKKLHPEVEKLNGNGDDGKEKSEESVKVQKEVKNGRTVFIHPISSEHIMYEIVLRANDVTLSHRPLVSL